MNLKKYMIIYLILNKNLIIYANPQLDQDRRNRPRSRNISIKSLKILFVSRTLCFLYVFYIEKNVKRRNILIKSLNINFSGTLTIK